MSWFEIGAVVIAALFALNFVVFVVRRSRAAGVKVAARATVRRQLPANETAIMLAAVASWVVCLAAPYVAPGSDLAQAMRAPWAVACVLAWTMAIAFLLFVALAVWRWRRGQSGG